MENVIYAWEFDGTKNRAPLWYILALSAVAGFSIWGIFTGQYGFSLIIILAAGVLFFVENNTPDRLQVQINDLGIKMGEQFYDFSKIASFSFVFNDEHPVAVDFILQKKGLKTLRLPINREIHGQLEAVLPNFIAEGETTELSTSEKIINFLGL